MEEFRDYGMREYKAPLSLRIKNFFMLHPMVVAILFAVIISLFMGGCSKAKAEAMNSSAEQYIRGVLSSYTNYNNEQNQLSYVFANYDNYLELVTNDTTPVTYFILYKGENWYGYPQVVYRNSNSYNPPYQFSISTQAGYGYSYFFSFESRTVQDFSFAYNSSTKRGIQVVISCFSSVNQFMISECSFETFGAVQSQTSTINDVVLDSYSTYTSKTQYQKFRYRQSLNSISRTCISGFDGGLGYGNYYCTVKSGTIPYLIQCDQFLYLTPITLYNGPEYEEDSRLRMYITNAIGGPRLNVNVVDFAKSFPYPDQTVLQPKEITITIETDGVETLFTLDPSTAIWASKYWATVPVSDVAELDGHDVVKITKVQFSMYDALSNMTEDFYIATDFALKDTTEEIDPSTILPPENIYEDAKSTVQIDLLVQTLEANGSGSVYGDFTYQSSIPVLPSWSDEIYTDLTRMEDNASAFAGHWYDHYPWSFGDLQINPVEYINEFCDGYASVYDVIIFRVYGWMLDASFSTDDPTIGSYTTGVKGYIVLYTNKFYNHSTSLTSLDILTALQSDANQQKSNWSWLVSKLNDFESKSLEVMNAELRVERESRDWLKSIWNQIDNLDIPVFDDTDILDKLDDIISALSGGGSSGSFNEDDTVSEAIVYYKNHNDNGLPTYQVWLDDKMSIWLAGKVHYWFQGSNASDDKTTLLSDVFDTMTSMYDAMSDETYFFSGIQLYLESLSGSDDSDVYQDPDYVYINHFFDNTFDPDSYDGYGGGVQ